MASEHLKINDPDYVVVIVFVFFLQEFQDFELDTRLMLKSFLVTDYFDCDHSLCFVIKALQSLAERARA